MVLEQEAVVATIGRSAAYQMIVPTAEPTVARKRFMNLSILAIVAIASIVVIAAFVLGSLLLVEDWSRDLTTNWAATHPQHADHRLRPYEFTGTAPELAARLRQSVATLPGWNWVDERSDGKEVVIRLTRSTKLFRFVDDVTVRIEPLPTDSGDAPGAPDRPQESPRVRLQAESKSRVGRGDLGQNPRNLRELLDSLRAQSS